MTLHQKNTSSTRVIYLMLTVAALVALLAVVLVRSRAETPTNVNQEVASAPTNMIVTGQALTQDATDVGGINEATPPNAVHLTSGSLSDPIHLTATIENDNGVNSVLVGRSNARLYVQAFHGTNPQEGTCKGLHLDGTQCWDRTIKGDAFVSTGVLIPDSNKTDETMIQLDVPITLPHYALDGTWTVYWQLIPTDASGNANGAYSVSNMQLASLIRMNVDKLVAIDVAANNGTTALYSAVGGGSIVPLEASAPVSIVVNQKGNVPDYVAALGTDWTNGDNSLTMPVSITHFLGTQLPSYNDVDAETLVSGDPSKAVRVNNASGSGVWIVPVSIGSLDNNVKTLGTNHYDTMIMPPAGRVGSFVAVLTNFASDASGAGGGGVSTSFTQQDFSFMTANDAYSALRLHQYYYTEYYADPSAPAWASGAGSTIGNGFQYSSNENLYANPAPFKATIDNGATYVNATLTTTVYEGTTSHAYEIALGDLVGSSPSYGSSYTVKIYASADNGVSWPNSPSAIATLHMQAAPNPLPYTIHWVDTSGGQHSHVLTDGYSLSLSQSTTRWIGVTGPQAPSEYVAIAGGLTQNISFNDLTPNPTPEYQLSGGPSFLTTLGTTNYDIRTASNQPVVSSFSITLTP